MSQLSRVGRKPIVLGQVKAEINPYDVVIHGKFGSLKVPILFGLAVQQENDTILVAEKKQLKQNRMMAGTLRALLANAVKGVSQPFEKTLMLVGVGYRAVLEGKRLQLSLGYSHPIFFDLPDTVTCVCKTPTQIVLSSISKEFVGEVAAKIRRLRKVERYKGKGIRFADEVIELKETKKK